jgi:hypothetical protein
MMRRQIACSVQVDTSNQQSAVKEVWPYHNVNQQRCFHSKEAYAALPDLEEESKPLMLVLAGLMDLCQSLQKWDYTEVLIHVHEKT